MGTEKKSKEKEENKKKNEKKKKMAPQTELCSPTESWYWGKRLRICA
jgi:hypothetical protein